MPPRRKPARAAAPKSAEWSAEWAAAELEQSPGSCDMWVDDLAAMQAPLQSLDSAPSSPQPDSGPEQAPKGRPRKQPASGARKKPRAFAGSRATKDMALIQRLQSQFKTTAREFQDAGHQVSRVLSELDELRAQAAKATSDMRSITEARSELADAAKTIRAQLEKKGRGKAVGARTPVQVEAHAGLQPGTASYVGPFGAAAAEAPACVERQFVDAQGPSHFRGELPASQAPASHSARRPTGRAFSGLLDLPLAGLGSLLGADFSGALPDFFPDPLGQGMPWELPTALQ